MSATCVSMKVVHVRVCACVWTYRNSCGDTSKGDGLQNYTVRLQDGFDSHSKCVYWEWNLWTASFKKAAYFSLMILSLNRNGSE